MSKILLVEDDRDIREALAELLTDEGYDVACASNGQEGLDYLRTQERPDLILLDLMMPIKDGAQFRAEQRSDNAISSIPVLIMSADNRATQKIDDPGVAGYLRKPVEIDELLQVVRERVGS